MATQTTHYNLIKPSSADRVAVGDLNDNSDTIDGYLYQANERADQIADDYNTSSTYNIGNYCRRENYIYKCNSDSVTGNWDSTKWDRVKVMESVEIAEDGVDNAFKTMGVMGAKNSLPYPYYSGATTINNVVITDNGDGTLTFNGTASSAGTYRLTHYNVAYSTRTLSKIPNGNYIATGGSDSVNLKVGYNNNGTISTYATDTGNGANFSIDHNSADYTGVYFELWFASGTVFNNFVVKPMIRLVSAKDSTYAPYAMTNKDLTDVVKFNQTTAGTYTLQATVASNGIVTYEWVSTT